MPIIQITASERVTYKREVEVSEAEYQAMQTKLDTLQGYEYSRAVESIVEKYIRRNDLDFFDSDDLDLDDLSVVV